MIICLNYKFQQLIQCNISLSNLKINLNESRSRYMKFDKFIWKSNNLDKSLPIKKSRWFLFFSRQTDRHRRRQVEEEADRRPQVSQLPVVHRQRLQRFAISKQKHLRWTGKTYIFYIFIFLCFRVSDIDFNLRREIGI